MTVSRRHFVQGLTGLLAHEASAALAKPPLHPAGSPLNAIYDQILRHHAEATSRLQTWIRQPSVNAEGLGMTEGCELLQRMCREAGFDSVQKVATPGAPAVFAQLHAGAPRTLAVYFMYDVKQASPQEWSSPPFAGALVTVPGVGKVVMGRGALNQKGPQLALLAALHAIRAAGQKLPVNLVLIAEGEEEDGSMHLPQVVRRPEITQALLGCQGLLLAGADQELDGGVEIALGAKGCLEVELIASGQRWQRGPRDRDIHSAAAPMVDSPVWHLVQALGTLVTPDGNDVAIAGVEAMVRPLTARDRAMLADKAKRTDEQALKDELSVSRWARDLPYQQSLERLAGRPSINIQGIVAGYGGPGGKTILPHQALAKLDLRLVPDMKGKATLQALRSHLAARGFADIEVRELSSYDPTTTAADSRIVQAALRVYRSYGIEPILSPRADSSWPGYLFTEAPLNLPAIEFGLGYGQGEHSRDEYYLVDSATPKVMGLAGAVRSFVDFLYTFAAV